MKGVVTVKVLNHRVVVQSMQKGDKLWRGMVVVEGGLNGRVMDTSTGVKPEDV